MVGFFPDRANSEVAGRFRHNGSTFDVDFAY